MKKYLIFGVALILVTNLFVLGGVFYNRIGEPTAQLVLSEREARLPYLSGFEKENSGVALSISWRALPNENNELAYYNNRSVALTEQQLIALGFSEIEQLKEGWAQERTLYFALEYNGELYQQSLAHAQRYYQKALSRFELDTSDSQLMHAKERAFETYEREQHYNSRHAKERAFETYEREQHYNSRLFFLEASQDYKALDSKYAEQNNIVIVKGNAKPYFNQQTKEHFLHVSSLLVNQINVPARYVDDLVSLKALRGTKASSYSVTVNWGQRLEPWIVDIKLHNPS
ncbi:DUF4824 family protein [Pseudoalteromonas sp. G4]|uniref:DUF4824 family protein n=1 Tax=Pseudoalteromonas sp. G4 TaxID=2992761 RepID=UPI00237DAE53|nr:DUF4824 family protein [Pseudoalteromonas sp. G4]MDE3274036.1 DUF4824 family protein [Pseudoalteromonas sp. G4]